MEVKSLIPKKCLVGICCMDVKGNSKPMQGLLGRLARYPELEIVMFGEQMILNQEVEEWPRCDVLIGFFSAGFPLQKAVKYMDHHPTVFSVNDLAWQHTLLDRRTVYTILKRNSIPTVRHLFVSRDGYEDEPVIEEYNNYIIINGKRMDKPFVEKPVDSEDHNIYIYYHQNQGGGSRRLFRKVEDKSSQFYPDVNTIRRTGSYIYEEFVSTEHSQDLKVYTVGLDYQHAEMRKSPVVDGKVLRGKDGKEVRRQVTLCPEEEEMASRIVKAFKQRICGFDILRGKEKSFVCDVNGWSFVKGHACFYDNCAKKLRELCKTAMISKGLPFVETQEGVRELRGIVSVFRHGDRTPKQKLKMKVTNKELLSFFTHPREEVKIKNESSGQQKINELLEIVRRLHNPNNANRLEGINKEDEEKLELVVTVLERSFGGLKIQLKPLKHSGQMVKEEGSDTPVLKETVEQALFICKWGGALTHSGMQQSRLMGIYFFERVFPKEHRKEFAENIRVFSNNERRVKRTAEEFSKGIFGKESLPSDFVMDNKQTAKLLGTISAGKDLMDKMKQELFQMMHCMIEDENLDDIPGFKQITDPLGMMHEILSLMKCLHNDIRENTRLCQLETTFMMQQRWERLWSNFYNRKQDTFDTTKIPDIFDYVTYDVIHNEKTLEGNDLYQLFAKAEIMARCVIPAEYGLRPRDKLEIGSLICEPLIHKILEDMIDFSKGDKSKARMYFSSESHLHTLRNILLHAKPGRFHQIIEPVELYYLTHIVLKIYENMNVDPQSEKRFQIEVLFSGGTNTNPFNVLNDKHCIDVRPMVSICSDLSLRELSEIVQLASDINQELSNRVDEPKHSIEEYEEAVDGIKEPVQ